MYIYPYSNFYIPKEFQDGLVAAYNGQHNGDTVIDIFGNGNHGTQYGGVIFGRLNCAHYMEFDGSNDYVSITHSSELNGETGLSIIVIASIADATASGNSNALVSKRTATEQKGNYGLYIQNGKIHFRIYKSTNTSDGLLGNTALSNNKTYFFGATYDDPTGRQAVYVNGYKDGEGTTSTGLVSGSANTQPLALGKERQTGDFGNLDGKGFLFAIYNKALSTKQIQKMYDRFRQRYHD